MQRLSHIGSDVSKRRALYPNSFLLFPRKENVPNGAAFSGWWERVYEIQVAPKLQTVGSNKHVQALPTGVKFSTITPFYEPAKYM